MAGDKGCCTLCYNDKRLKFEASLNVLNSNLWNKCINKKYHMGGSAVVMEICTAAMHR